MSKKLKIKTLAALLALLALPSIVAAQTLDLFLGYSAVSCPVSLSPGSPGYSVTATCSKSGTTVTCTLPTGQGANFSAFQPIKISGSGTALDTVFNDTSMMWGEDSIQRGGIVGDVITLTAPTAATVGNTSVTFADGHYYVPEDASGNPVTVAVPGWGNRKAICTPQGHFYYLIGMSNVCVSVVNGGCALGSATASSANTTRLNNVATLTTSIASTNVRFWNVGQPISVTNCTDTSYNTPTISSPSQVPIKIISLTGTMVVTYSSPGLDDSVGTAGCKIQAFGWNPIKFQSFAGTQPDPRCNTQLGESARYATMGFTAPTSEDSDLYTDPTRTSPCNVGPSNGNTRWYPIFTGQSTPAASRYPGVNLWGCSSQPVKIPYFTVQPNIVGKNTALVLLDWKDPHWQQWHDCNWNPDPNISRNALLLSETPGQVGMLFDDSDNMSQTRSSGVIPTVGLGVPVPDPGIITLYSAPQITISNKALYTNGIWTTPLVFPDSCNYYKDLATDCGLTAPTVCTDIAPCSLADFLRIRYGNIAALNAAWNTTYTTFGSVRTVVNAEAHTLTDTALSNSGITKRSVQLVITPSGGSPVVVTGDCTLNMTDCPAGTAGTAQFLAPPACFNGGTSNYYLTAGIICTDPNGDIEQVSSSVGSGLGKGQTGTAAPTWPAATSCVGTTTVTNNVTFTCRGPKITGTLTYATGAIALTAGGTGTLPTGESLTVNYSVGGWDAGGTCTNCIGLEDDDGLGGRGGVTLANGVNPVCPQPYATGITVTAYKTEVSFVIAGSNFWAMATSSGVTSDPSPAFTSTTAALVTGSDGIKWEMIGAPTSDAANGVNFHNACGTYNNSNAAITSDLADFDRQFFDVYFKGLHEVTAQYHILNFGVNFGLGTYNSPTWIGGLQAANQYTDAAFVGTTAYFTTPSLDALSKLTLDYEFNYFKRPVAIEPFMGSCAGDWQGQSKSCTNSQNFFNGLVARAHEWYSLILGELNYQAPDGTRPYAGATWWPDHSNDQGGGSFAKIDFSDNRIDGVEDVAASVPCDAPLSSLTCGGELASVPWLGINEETCSQCIIPANALPYSGAAPTVTPTAPARPIIMAKTESRRTPHSTKPLDCLGNCEAIINSLGGQRKNEPFVSVHP